MDDFSGVLKIVMCMQSWRDLEEVQEKGKCLCVRPSNGSCVRFGDSPIQPALWRACPIHAQDIYIHVAGPLFPQAPP
jgi:hypothetical protein